MAKKNKSNPAQQAASLPTCLEDITPRLLSELATPPNSILDEVPYRAINHLDDRVARDILTYDTDMICALANTHDYTDDDTDDDTVKHLNVWIEALSKFTLDEDVTFSNDSVAALLYALVTAKIQIIYLHAKLKTGKAK